MFVTLQNGAMLNLFWLQDCFQGKHEQNIVIFYLINGVKLTEEYSTPQLASNRVEDVHSIMALNNVFGAKFRAVTVLPVTGEPGIIYLVPSTNPELNNIKDEYIWTMDNEWEAIGTTSIELENYLEKQVGGDASKFLNERNEYVNVAVNRNFPGTFVTDGTMDEFCESVLSESSSSAGMSYLGALTCTDLPFEGNAECLVSVIQNSFGDEILYLELYSTNIAPYKWTGMAQSGTFLGWRGSILATDVLTKNNNTHYTPSNDYNPATKLYVDTSLQNKKNVSTMVLNTVSTTGVATLVNNTEFRFTIPTGLSSLGIMIPSDIPIDFECTVVFKSGDIPTTTSMNTDYSLKVTGDDVTSNGIFIPEPNKVYNLFFWYDGVNVNCQIRGV